MHLLFPFFCIFIFSVNAQIKENVNETRDYELEKTFSRTNVKKLRSALANLRQRWNTRLQQMPVKKANSINGKFDGANEQPKIRSKVRDRVKIGGDTLPQVNKAAGLNDILYQGDMVLTEEQIATILESQDPGETVGDRVRRQAYRDRYYPSTIWGSAVYYYYDQTATQKIKKAFEAAVEFWQNYTCINIYQSTTAPNRIRVFQGQGCYSYVGRVSGVQDLSLGEGCEEFGTAAHELGHALGFFHMQSRYDRDNYISIKYQNIETSFIEQFDKETSSTNYNYGIPYDYGSIMQYGATSASSNDQPTMIALDTEYQDTMGSDFVSFYDISMMNEHYSCKELCPSETSAKCTNSGFPNPRNCAQCICPSGYGGILCNERPSGCGQELTATSTWQNLSNTVGDGIPTLRDNNTMCYYWIKAAEGEAIEIEIKELATVTIDGCIFGGVEMKTNKDQKLTGYRYCSSADTNTTHKSTGNLIPVIIYNRYASTKVVLNYRTITATEKNVEVPVTTISPVINRCEDMHPKCQLYRFYGLCRRRIVRNNCRFSCNSCRRQNHNYNNYQWWWF